MHVYNTTQAFTYIIELIDFVQEMYWGDWHGQKDSRCKYYLKCSCHVAMKYDVMTIDMRESRSNVISKEARIIPHSRIHVSLLRIAHIVCL